MSVADLDARTFPTAKVFAIFVRDARAALSYLGNFTLSWLTIGVEVVVAWYLSRLIPPSPKFGAGGAVASYFQYLAINFAFVRFQTTALGSFAEAIRDGQLMGTLEAVLATPTDLPIIVLSSGVWSFALTTLQTITYLGLALLFGLDLSHVNGASAVLFIALTVLAISPLGVLAAAVTIALKKTGPVEWLSTSMANLFGGVFLPTSSLPLPMQAIGWCLPITHALAGIRGAVQGLPPAALASDAIWLLCAAVLLMPLSLAAFRWAVHRAKVDGTLGQY